uniref:NADH-ubiquinone oxidoreductase chain 4 n=1 Tax=Aderidae sp. GENSP01 TaxID=1205532 RepID=A0A0S2MPB6_9CUCU|nr:NADH deshydrogenase subunit 4 [Aderidae sp. GENSP01]
MMKMLFFIIFMMPLNFMGYWFLQWIWLMMSFIFIFFYSVNYYCLISFSMGLDLLSYLMILLSFWICSLMILASEKIYKLLSWNKLFLLMIYFLMISFYLMFSSLNLFILFFFEISLIPTLMLIIGWGYQPERLQAGFYLFFYTIFMSLPMMIMSFFVGLSNYSLEISFLKVNFNSLFIFILMNMVFFVKMPMYFLHLWLPKAHVEAPVSGSMILAGVMLKLGSYGLMRFLKMFMLSLNFNYIFISMSLMGGLIISILCLCQSDMKSLVAYSSVSHMSLCLCGILTLNSWGMMGGLILSLGHGLCSSGLFSSLNLIYERLGSRSLYLSKGLINIMPSFSFWMFLLVSSNMSFPPSLNLLSEIFLMISILGFSNYLMILLMMISFFSAGYSLYLYSFSHHGKIFQGFNIMSLNIREFLMLMLHWFPLNLMFLKMDLFMWL